MGYVENTTTMKGSTKLLIGILGAAFFWSIYLFSDNPIFIIVLLIALFIHEFSSIVCLCLEYPVDKDHFMPFCKYSLSFLILNGIIWIKEWADNNLTD